MDVRYEQLTVVTLWCEGHFSGSAQNEIYPPRPMVVLAASIANHKHLVTIGAATGTDPQLARFQTVGNGGDKLDC
jgi:hypothetical protein